MDFFPFHILILLLFVFILVKIRKMTHGAILQDGKTVIMSIRRSHIGINEFFVFFVIRTRRVNLGQSPEGQRPI